MPDLAGSSDEGSVEDTGDNDSKLGGDRGSVIDGSADEEDSPEEKNPEDVSKGRGPTNKKQKANDCGPGICKICEKTFCKISTNQIYCKATACQVTTKFNREGKKRMRSRTQARLTNKKQKAKDCGPGICKICKKTFCKISTNQIYCKVTACQVTTKFNRAEKKRMRSRAQARLEAN